MHLMALKTFKQVDLKLYEMSILLLFTHFPSVFTKESRAL